MNIGSEHYATGTEARAEMVALWETGNYSLRQLGKMYGLHWSTVHYQTEPRVRQYKKSKQATARRLKKATL